MTDNVVQLRAKPRITVLPVVDEPERVLVKALPLLLPAIGVNERNVSKEDVVADIMSGQHSDPWLCSQLYNIISHP